MYGRQAYYSDDLSDLIEGYRVKKEKADAIIDLKNYLNTEGYEFKESDGIFDIKSKSNKPLYMKTDGKHAEFYFVVCQMWLNSSEQIKTECLPILENQDYQLVEKRRAGEAAKEDADD